MDLQKIKAQISQVEKIAYKEIDESSPAKASQEMAKNQAIRTLQQLKELEADAVKQYSSLFLVTGAKEKVLKAFEKEGCLVGDHLYLARDVAHKFWPQFRSGTSLNSHIVQQMNNYMDDLCGQLGLDNYRRPQLTMEMQYQDALQSEEELVFLLEKMFQNQLKNQSTDSEGHILQALITCSELKKKFALLDEVGQNLYFTITVPEINDAVVDAYRNLLSTNVYTAAIKPKLNAASDEKIEEAVKTVLKRKEA